MAHVERPPGCLALGAANPKAVGMGVIAYGLGVGVAYMLAVSHS